MERKLKMLESYIHEYFLKRNYRSTADIFAREANVQPPIFPVNGSEEYGILVDWWILLLRGFINIGLETEEQSTGTVEPNAPAGGAVAQSAPAESSRGGGSVAKRDAGSMLQPPRNPTQMGDDQFDSEWLTKLILKDLPTATLTELASKTELQVVRDVAAQMLGEQEPAAGPSTKKPRYGD